MKQILIEKYIEPSEVKINGNYAIKLWYNKYGECHSFLGQPAFIKYYKTQIREQRWYTKDELHRDRGLSAYLGYCNEKISCKIWYKNGKRIK